MIAPLTGCGGGIDTESAANTNAAGEAGATAGETGTTAAVGNATFGDTVEIGILADRSPVAAVTVVWTEVGAKLAV